MKCHPSHFFIEDEPGPHHQLRKVERMYTVNDIEVEINTLTSKQINRIFIVNVALDVKIAKIELPNETVIGSEIW
jgi:hypothetical protein